MTMSVALTLTLRDMLSAPARAALESVRAAAQHAGAGMAQINTGADAARASVYRLSTGAQSALDAIRGRARGAAVGVDAVAVSTESATAKLYRLSTGAQSALDAIRGRARGAAVGVDAVAVSTESATAKLYRLSTGAQSALDAIRGRARTAAASVDQVAKSSAGAAAETARLAQTAGELARERVDNLRASVDTVAQSGRTARTALSSVREAGDRVNGIRLDGPVQQLEQVAQRASAARRALESMVNAGRGVAAGVAGMTAGAAVATRAVEKPLAYDDRVTQIAKTAYADVDTTAGQRKAAKASINAGVMRAVREGGGSRDGAAEALSELMASNIYKLDEALAILPDIQRYATAGDANPVDLANIAIAARRNMGIEQKDIGTVLGKALAGGQAGSMEIKDMAKWLPQQMAAASTIGMSGVQGFERLVLANQMSAITAGSKDEAGNNLVNLLAKINSADTAKDVAKIKINGKPIDLSASLAAAREKGVNSLDAFLNLVDQVAAQDKGYQRVKERQKNAKNSTELAAALKDEEKILESKGIFKIIQDRQALMGLIGERANPKYKQEVQAALKDSDAALPRAQAWDRENLSQKVLAVKNEKDNAATQTLEKIDGPLGKMLDAMSDTARAYPALTTGAYAAATALGVLAAVVGGSGLVSRILQRGAGAPRVPTTVPTTVPTAPATVPAGRPPMPTAPAGAPRAGTPAPAPVPATSSTAPAPVATPATPRTAGVAEAARQNPTAAPAAITADRGRQAYLDALARESARGAAVRADVAVQQSRVGRVLDAARAQPLGKANVALSAGFGLYNAWQIEQQNLPQRQRVVEHTKNAAGVVGGLAGGWAGAAAGAAAGAPLAPFTGGLSVPVMAAIGGLGGGLGGGAGAQRIVELLTELLAEQKKPAPPPPPPPPVQITNNMVVDGSVVTSVVNDINAREVRRAH